MTSQWPQFSLPSLAQALLKHKLAVGSVWIVVSAVLALIVYFLPRVYEAQALVLLESQRIPQNFVSSTTVTANLWERLRSLEQRVLSYAQLVDLIDTLGLYESESKTLTAEQLVQKMRADINIQLEPGLGGSRDRPPAFRVGFSALEPKQAAQVANRLANLFIEHDLRVREGNAAGTADFLETQLESAKDKLLVLEAEVSRYKSQHNGELPQQEVALLGTLTRLEAQLRANQEANRQAQQNQFFARQALDEAVSAERDLMLALGSQRPGSESAFLVRPEEDPTRRLRSELAELRLRYTENHPDVLAKKRALEQLEAAILEASQSQPPASHQAQDGGADPETPSKVDPAPIIRAGTPELQRRKEQISKLRAQLEALSSQIQTIESDRQQILDDIATQELQVKKLPIREQEMAAMVRDYEITKANYQSLLLKKMDADTAMAMEVREKSERFVLLESARVPAKPIKPKVLTLNLLACGVGLLCGCIFGVVLEFKKNVLLGEWELPEGFPVLGRVPEFSVENAAGALTAWSGRPPVRTGRGVVAISTLLAAVALAVATAIHFGWLVN